MNSAIKRLPGNTIELTIVVPWTQIQETFAKTYSAQIAEIELPGFRKGKAPKELALKQVNKTKVLEDVLKEIVPKIYADAIKELNLTPIITPKVEVLEADENKDWKILINTCEKPTIQLGSYQEEISKLKAGKKNKIWVPGESKATDKKTEEVTLADMIETLARVVKVELSPLMIETETNRLLSNLVQELQKLGLTVQQYTQSQNKTSDILKQDYADQARKTLALEFALEEIAEKEQITIEPQEIQEFINKAKSEAEKKQMEQEQYYIGSLLRRQKTLSHLLKPAIIST